MFRDLIDDFDDESAEPDTFLDVPFVPTDDGVIEAMLTLGRVNAKDVLYDLGSGDGRILITAARKRGTRGIGVELDPLRIADAMDDAASFRVECQVDFIEEDIFTVDFSEATVVTMYLLESINIQLRPRILSELRPGTRVLSHAFNMGDWMPDDQLDVGGISIYKWVVPASVAGTWTWEGLDGRLYQVDLQQRYQEVSGTASIADEAAELQGTLLTGSRLELSIQEATATPPKHFTLDFVHGELQSIMEDA